MKDQLNKMLTDWLREKYPDVPQEEFDKTMEEGRLLAEEAGFTFKTPTESLMNHINNYNKWKSHTNNT